MEKIKSFQVDHRTIDPGVYISRVDGDITTYDLRTRKPNTADLMDHVTMHSAEHMFATMVRSSALKDDVIYFGPMGCQTGFYLLIRNADNQQVIDTIKKVLQDIVSYDGEMPGNSEIECGNYRSLDLSSAKEECASYLEKIKNIGVQDLQYKN